MTETRFMLRIAKVCGRLVRKMDRGEGRQHQISPGGEREGGVAGHLSFLK